MTLRVFTTAAATMAACVVMAFAVPLPVPAQSVLPAVPDPALINDEEVRSFAAAVIRVKRVADSYLPVLASAQTTQEQERVEAAAFEEIKQVVESGGFTVSRFNQILALTRVSPDLVDRVRSHLPQ